MALVRRRSKALPDKEIAVNAESITQDILKEAHIIKIPSGEAKGFAEKVGTKVAKWADKRGQVTRADINEKIADELTKYNKNLAFVYNNRGKII